jgi:glutamyl/glutaminyl-tRNA synthetase
MQLCTLEFETRRASYYWLLHALGLYQPYVWEYSRLNVTNTVMSKRKVSENMSVERFKKCHLIMLLYYLSL